MSPPWIRWKEVGDINTNGGVCDCCSWEDVVVRVIPAKTLASQNHRRSAAKHPKSKRSRARKTARRKR